MNTGLYLCHMVPSCVTEAVFSPALCAAACVTLLSHSNQNSIPHNSIAATEGSVQHWLHRWYCVPDEALFVSRRFLLRLLLLISCLIDVKCPNKTIGTIN